MNIFSEYASKLHESGYNVCPVNSQNECFVKGREKWGQTRQTDTELQYLVEKHPNDGIAVVCGKGSGILFFDQDFDGEGQDFFSEVVRQIIPPSPVQRKGSKNFAAAYRWTAPPADFKFTIKRGGKMFCELLANGRYMVIPPTIHPKGMPYKWLTEDTLIDIDPKELPEFDWNCWEKLELLSQSEAYPFDKEAKASGLGGRQGALLGYVMKACDQATSIEELASLAFEFDKTLHGEKMYFNDKAYFKGASPMKAALKSCEKWVKWIKKGRASKGIEWNIGQKLKHPSLLTNFYIEEKYIDKNGEEKIRSTPDYNGWAEYIVDTKNFFTSQGPTYIYDDIRSYYRTICEQEVEAMLTKTTKGYVKPHHRSHFIRVLRAHNFKGMDTLLKTSGMINLNNGSLNLKTKELEPHSPKNFFTYCLPHDYDQDAKCEKWIKFLDEVFQGNEELKLVAAQIFGYILMGGHPWLHKAFVLFGTGRNGKSTFLDVLKALIGFHNFASVSLAKLNNPFSVVQLDSMLANVVEETPNDKINAETFKTAIGGGHLVGCKKYEDEYQFQCNSRFIFACNEMPRFSENSTGLQERLYFLPFKTYIEKEKRNGNILNELLAELPGILNWALTGLDILIAEKRLPESESTKETFEEYKTEADSVYQWATENISFDQRVEFVKTKEIYKKYRFDLRDTGRFPVTDMTFYKRLKKYIKEKYPTIEETRRGSDRGRGYEKIFCSLIESPEIQPAAQRKLPYRDTE